MATNTIKTTYFHIKGKPFNTVIDSSVVNNYVMASLSYTKGIGYTWSIGPIGQYTVKDEKYGDYVMNRLTVHLKKDTPEIWQECLVECQRKGKAKEREATELFDSNVVSAIINRLGYNVEEG